jgi:hypothetical protein
MLFTPRISLSELREAPRIVAALPKRRMMPREYTNRWFPGSIRCKIIGRERLTWRQALGVPTEYSVRIVAVAVAG